MALLYQQVVDHLGTAVLAGPEERRAAVRRLSDDVLSIVPTDSFDLSTQFVRQAGAGAGHLQQSK